MVRRVVLVRGRTGVYVARVPRGSRLVTCGAAPLAACTSDDVVAGLAQLSAQLQGVSAYLFVVSCIFVLVAIASVSFAFVAMRRG